ncbi:MAG: hypothetical protein IJO79_00485 [Firmicutes bacterium]|nr:hypothetical protein [Bacillota bacterium]
MQENTMIRGPLFDEEGRMAIIDGMRYYKKTQDQNNMVRFCVELDEAVDPECLAYGVRKALRRLRIFRLAVVSDEKRFFLKEHHGDPVIHENVPGRYTVGGEENSGYLNRVGFSGNQISIDFFHGITDGAGLSAFARTMLYYYYLKKNGAAPAADGRTLLEDTPEDPREYADCQLFVPEEEVQGDKRYEYAKAFQIPEERMTIPYASKCYLLKADAEAFERVMRKAGSSRSGMLAAFMNRVIDECHDIGDEPIVAALAADARKAYGAEKTLQCCVSTLPVWYDREIRELSFAEQLGAARKMIAEGAAPHNVVAAAQRTRKFNEALDTRFATLEEKKAFARQVNKQGGVKYTYGLSYVGEIQYDPGVQEHVKASYFMLCANTIPVIIEAAKCGALYYICYCTQLVEDPYVFRLQEKFLSEGIPCTCEQQADFEETLALF